MGSMSACAVTENPSTYSYERGKSRKPDSEAKGQWLESGSTCGAGLAFGHQSSPPTGSRPYRAARRSLSSNSSGDQGG